MAWTDPVARTVGFLVGVAEWNAEHVANLLQLKTHAHGGVTGEGSQALGPMTTADFTTAAAPAAPGAGKGRLYVATGDRPGYRAGAAGAAEVLVTDTATQDLSNKTLILPVIGDFSNAGHSHTGTPGGGQLSGVSVAKVKTADQSVTASTTFVPDTHLVGAVDASSTYRAELIVYITEGNNGSADFKWRLMLPSGASMVLHHAILYMNTSGLTFVIAEATAPGGTNTMFINASPGTIKLHITGHVVIAGTAGNVQFEWAQNTSQASATVVEAGSTMLLTKV